MSDLIRRRDAIDALIKWYGCEPSDIGAFENIIEKLPPAQPEIIRCKDCKFYSPMNRETKTGICNLIMHQNFGDNWFCAGAERRPDESDRKRRCLTENSTRKEELHE